MTYNSYACEINNLNQTISYFLLKKNFHSYHLLTERTKYPKKIFNMLKKLIAVMKSVYLALKEATKKWTMPIKIGVLFSTNLRLLFKKSSDYKNPSLAFLTYTIRGIVSFSKNHIVFERKYSSLFDYYIKFVFFSVF